MNILIAGDWHGDINHARRIIQTAADNDVYTVFQVGDFGLMRQDDFLFEVSACAYSNGVTVIWLDGNHEDFDYLESIMRYNSRDHRPFNSYGQFVKCAPNVWYSHRGTVLTVGDKNIMTYGGAVSIDREYRTKNVSWWQQEEILEVHIENTIYGLERSGVKIDILLTHDAPTSIKLPIMRGEHPLLIKSEESRKLITKLGDAVKPEIWFHGHYHMFDVYSHNDESVFALTDNFSARNTDEDYSRSYVIWNV